MAEIDEAEAVTYHEWVIEQFEGIRVAESEVSAARAALAWKARADAAEADAAATQRLYMAAVMRCDDAEAEVHRLTKAQAESAEASRLYVEHSDAEIARLKAEVERLKANVERRIANSPLPRCPHCQGYGTCECGTSTSCHVCLGTGRAR